MSILMVMKRVTIAEAKQTLPALVHEVERRGEVEITRRGRTVAYLVSAVRHAAKPKRTFLEAFEQWRDAYAEAVGDEPFALPARRPARKTDLSK